MDKHTIGKIVRHPHLIIPEYIKYIKFEKFIEKYLIKTSTKYTNYKELGKEIDSYNYDVIISGGDQVWSMRNEDFELSYLQPFKIPNCKKISYSASLSGWFEADGSPSFTLFPDLKEQFLKYVSEFDGISVREEMAAAYLSRALKRDIKVGPDPTMIIPQKFWNNLVSDEPLLPYDYILYYSPTAEPKAECLAAEYGERKGLPVINTNDWYRDKRFVRKQDVGPLEFLNLVKYAKCVIGRSFHLLVFALVFNKEFYVISKNRDQRILNLINAVGMEDRFLSDSIEILKESHSFPDPNIVQKLIETYSTQASSYFQKFSI